MTHYPTVVFVKGADPIAEAERLLAPFDENEEFFREGSRWDWWVLGGRWDGAMLGEEPETVKVPCRLCEGTGTREDFKEVLMADRGPLSRAMSEEDADRWIAETNGCNGCRGKGFNDELPW